jgi:hypothetical protein
MRMKALACCRRRPQDFSIDMDQEPDSKSASHTTPLSSLILLLCSAPLPGQISCNWSDLVAIFASCMGVTVLVSGCTSTVLQN